MPLRIFSAKSDFLINEWALTVCGRIIQITNQHDIDVQYHFKTNMSAILFRKLEPIYREYISIFLGFNFPLIDKKKKA